jgi:hypothetical protein
MAHLSVARQVCEVRLTPLGKRRERFAGFAGLQPLGNNLFVFSLQIQLPWNSGLLLPGGRFISNMFSVLTSR